MTEPFLPGGGGNGPALRTAANVARSMLVFPEDDDMRADPSAPERETENAITTVPRAPLPFGRRLAT